MTSPLCRCGCGRELTRHSYETERQWEKRLALGLYRSRCKRNLPAKVERGKPTLELVSCNLARPEMVAQGKEKTPRDPAYLDWIRTFDCVSCGWPAHMGNIEAHHIETGGTSIKCSDYLTVPLCSFQARGCHTVVDKTPELVEKYKPWALRFNAMWVAAGNKIKKGEG